MSEIPYASSDIADPWITPPLEVQPTYTANPRQFSSTDLSDPWITSPTNKPIAKPIASPPTSETRTPAFEAALKSVQQWQQSRVEVDPAQMQAYKSTVRRQLEGLPVATVPSSKPTPQSQQLEQIQRSTPERQPMPSKAQPPPTPSGTSARADALVEPTATPRPAAIREAIGNAVGGVGSSLPRSLPQAAGRFLVPGVGAGLVFAGSLIAGQSVQQAATSAVAVTAGSVVGGIIGTAIGGPLGMYVGSMIGGFVGGQLANALFSQQLSSTAHLEAHTPNYPPFLGGQVPGGRYRVRAEWTLYVNGVPYANHVFQSENIYGPISSISTGINAAGDTPGVNVVATDGSNNPRTSFQGAGFTPVGTAHNLRNLTVQYLVGGVPNNNNLTQPAPPIDNVPAQYIQSPINTDNAIPSGKPAAGLNKGKNRDVAPTIPANNTPNSTAPFFPGHGGLAPSHLPNPTQLPSNLGGMLLHTEPAQKKEPIINNVPENGGVWAVDGHGNARRIKGRFNNWDGTGGEGDLYTAANPKKEVEPERFNNWDGSGGEGDLLTAKRLRDQQAMIVRAHNGGYTPVGSSYQPLGTSSTPSSVSQQPVLLQDKETGEIITALPQPTDPNGNPTGVSATKMIPTPMPITYAPTPVNDVNSPVPKTNTQPTVKTAEQIATDKTNQTVEQQKKDFNDQIAKLTAIATAIAALSPMVQGVPDAIAKNPAVQAANKKTTQGAVCEIAQPGGCLGNALDNSANNINQNNNQNTANLLDKINTGANVAQLALLNIINSKLGEQVTGGISGFMNRIVKNQWVDRAINLITMTAAVHNVIMLSDQAATTFFGILDNVLAIPALIIDANAESIDTKQAFGGVIDGFFKNIFGVAEWAEIKTRWATANRIYQAAANGANEIRSIGGNIISAVEQTAQLTGKGFNAMQDEGLLSESNWDYSPENLKLKGGMFAKFGKIADGINVATQGLEAIESITSEIRSAVDSANQIKENAIEIDNEVKALFNQSKIKREKEVEALPAKSYAWEDLI